MDRTVIYKMFSLKRAKGVNIDPSLCFYNPEEVYIALNTHGYVKRWLKYIADEYVPPNKEVLLIYPCSSEKPYHKSRSYKVLFRTLSLLGRDRSKVHVATVSEPFCLVPEEFYGRKDGWFDWETRWYDCPVGLQVKENIKG